MSEVKEKHTLRHHHCATKYTGDRYRAQLYDNAIDPSTGKPTMLLAIFDVTAATEALYLGSNTEKRCVSAVSRTWIAPECVANNSYCAEFKAKKALNVMNPNWKAYQQNGDIKISRVDRQSDMPIKWNEPLYLSVD